MSSPCSRMYAAVLVELIDEKLLQVRGARSHLRQPRDRVGGEMKPIEIVQHRHVERRRDRPFFLVAADVQVARGSSGDTSAGESATDSRDTRR